MTLKELRNKTNHLPEDTVLVVQSHDHSYEVAECSFAVAEQHGNHLSEYHGDQYMQPGSSKVHVLVIG